MEFSQPSFDIDVPMFFILETLLLPPNQVRKYRQFTSATFSSGRSHRYANHIITEVNTHTHTYTHCRSCFTRLGTRLNFRLRDIIDYRIYIYVYDVIEERKYTHT